MPKARGIHASPYYKLGRKRPSNKPALMAREFVDVSKAPPFDPVDDNLLSLPFGLYGNDQFGDCGPVSVANDLIASTGGSVVPTLQEVLALYKLCNPTFDPNTGAGDDGVDMQSMLELLMAHGIGGVKPVAFAKIEAHDDAMIEAATNIFDGTLHGATLQKAQQAQTDTVDPTWVFATPHAIWGGHAFFCGQYVAATATQTVISWALKVRTALSFRTHQLEEVWLVVWPHQVHRPGVDVEALRTAFLALTGDVLPVPVAPPVPTPVPGDLTDAAMWTDMVLWTNTRHVGSNRRAALRLREWARAKGFIG